MANGIVRYLLEAVGGPQVRQALRGIVGESRAADRAILASSRTTTTARGRMARQEGAEARRGAQIRVRAETDADRAILASAQSRSREERRLRQAEERDLRRSLRGERPRGQGGRGGALRAVGSAALAVGDALVGRVQGWQGALGVPSRDELIRRTMTNQLALARMTSEAGMSEDQMRELQARVLTVSRSTGADASSLIEGLGVGQERFSDLQGTADQLEAIARAARAADAPVQDMVGALGEFQRQMGVSSADSETMLGLLADGMSEGSLNAGDVASNFSSIMSDFTALRGEGGRGVGGATEFLALAQALGGAGAGPEGARTLAQNMIANLRRGEVRNALEGRDGLNDSTIFDERGRMTIGFDELISRMAAAPNMQNADVMEEIFGNDMQAASARAFLLEQTRNGRNPISELMGVSATRGTELIGRSNERMDATEAGRASRIAANAEADFMENGNDLLRVMNDAVGPFTELSNQYPLAAEALGTMREAISAVTTALGGLGLASMGAQALGLGGGGGAVAAAVGGGGGMAALGTAGSVLAPAVGLAALGGVGYQLYSGEQRAREEESRRAQANRVLASDLSLVTPENIANATGSSTLVRDAERSRTQRQLRSQADANMAAFMGGPNEVTGEVRIADASVDAIGRAAARAIDRGAPAAGRQPGETGRRR